MLRELIEVLSGERTVTVDRLKNHDVRRANEKPVDLRIRRGKPEPPIERVSFHTRGAYRT
jgi:hypothetical protein